MDSEKAMTKPAPSAKAGKVEHEWEKKNLVGLYAAGRGIYDLYQCKNCGKKYRRYGLVWYPPTSACKPKESNK